MPYIIKELRPDMDGIVQHMKTSNIMDNDGQLNYVLFKYCKDHIHPSYRGYRNFIGELNECVAEIRRRILARYEDSKIKLNTDV